MYLITQFLSCRLIANVIHIMDVFVKWQITETGGLCFEEGDRVLKISHIQGHVCFLSATTN